MGYQEGGFADIEDPGDLFDDGELHGAIDAAEADDSPEQRRRKAEAIVGYVLGYRVELRKLVRKRVIAERAYRWHGSRETRWMLMEAVADEVTCRLAIEHIGHVSEEIREGGFDYIYREEREFEGAFRDWMRRSMKRIGHMGPRQGMLGGMFAGQSEIDEFLHGAPKPRQRTRTKREEPRATSPQLAWGWE